MPAAANSTARAHGGTRPDPERQIHRACGDVRAALLGALELLSGTRVPRIGRDDIFRAFSDLGRIQQNVDLALHATNLLDQMVGIPAEQRQPWSYYRDLIRGQATEPAGNSRRGEVRPRRRPLAPSTPRRNPGSPYSRC